MTTRIKYDYEFMAGVVFNDMLMFNRFRFSIDMYPAAENEFDHNTAFDRMSYVINDIASHSVFINEDDTDAIMRIANANIPVLTVPPPGPIDQIIAMVLMSKLNAVVEETFIITEVQIESQRGNFVRYVYEYDEDDDEEMSIISDSPLKWWNESEPRFVSLASDDELKTFKCDQGWEDMELGWDEEVDDIICEMEDKPVAVSEPNSNIIRLTPKTDEE